MKNYENTALLAHKRAVDAERKAQAILKRRAQAQRAALAMAKVAKAK